MKADKSATYKVTTVHPAGYKDGEHTLTVSVNRDGSRYVKGVGFGCSRDYATRLNLIAIQNLLAENGMRMIRMVKVS